MDYRAIGELIFMSLIGMSTLLFVLALGARFALKPILQDLFKGRKGWEASLAEERMERLEGRVVELETELDRVRSGQEFDRRLQDGPQRGLEVGS